MKLFVQVAGQLGHDVMNELNKRGYKEYSGTSSHHNALYSADIINASKKPHYRSSVDGVGTSGSLTAVDAAEEAR